MTFRGKGAEQASGGLTESGYAPPAPVPAPAEHPLSPDAATERVERARAREAAGWPHGLVSALNILEYGCDEGDYDEEVAAVTRLAEAATKAVDALNFYDAVLDAGGTEQRVQLLAAMRRLRDVLNG